MVRTVRIKHEDISFSRALPLNFITRIDAHDSSASMEFYKNVKDFNVVYQWSIYTGNRHVYINCEIMSLRSCFRVDCTVYIRQLRNC